MFGQRAVGLYFLFISKRYESSNNTKHLYLTKKKGTGGYESITSPTEILTDERIDRIEVGGDHTFLLFNNGDIKVSGSNNDVSSLKVILIFLF